MSFQPYVSVTMSPLTVKPSTRPLAMSSTIALAEASFSRYELIGSTRLFACTNWAPSPEIVIRSGRLPEAISVATLA